MNMGGIAKLVTLLVLTGAFVAVVLITPRIWRGTTVRAAAPVTDPGAASAERHEALRESDSRVGTS